MPAIGTKEGALSCVSVSFRLVIGLASVTDKQGTDQPQAMRLMLLITELGMSKARVP
jgi:hypothetical protein